MTTTTRIVFDRKEHVTCEPYEVGAPEPAQVTVRTHYSVISPGTELAFLHQLPNAIADYPIYPGYSAAGEIVATGSSVTDLQVGERVAAQTLHAGASNVAAQLCWKLPPGLSMREAAGFRLIAISLQGIRKVQLQLGESVVVIGLGVIGNLAGQLARAAGSTCVIGVDPVDWRRELAARCGFDHVLAPDQLPTVPALTQSDGPQIVIEATGRPEAVNTALQVATRLGRVLLLGSTRGLTEAVNFYRDVHKKGVTVIGAHDGIRAADEDIGWYFTMRSDGKTALQLAAAGRVQLEPLLSATFPATDAPRAYQALLEPEQRLMTAILDWSA